MRFVEQHIVNCIRASMAEARGEVEEANRLHAQAKLRLICMSDEELQELAEQISLSSEKKIEETYLQLKWAVASHEETVDDWLGQLFTEMSTKPIK